MKTFINIKLMWMAIFVLNLQSTIINHQSLNLYAQNQELFEHTWYFHNGQLQGEEFLPLPYFTGNLDFYIEVIEVYHNFCESAGGATIIDLNNELFILQDFAVPFQGSCIDGDEISFLNKHYSIYGDWNSGACNNPFAYTIETINDYLQLTIENGEGDWAVYNSVLLSTSSFNQNRFALYPNPVKDVLQVNNSSNQPVTAIIYDIHGKKLQTHSLENNLSTINVKALKQGLYFVVFESEAGERVSKKFVKK